MRRYNPDSIARALVHHDVLFRRLIGPGATRQWRVETGVGTVEFTNAEAHAYALGLADGMRKYKASE